MDIKINKLNIKWAHGSRARRPGFTLIEVMVAVMVVALGFMAAASMVIESTRSTGFSRSRTIALYLAESKLEELSREKYSSVTDKADDGSVPTTYKNFYTRSWVVEEGKPARKMKTVTVTITSKDTRVRATSLSTILVDI